MSFEKLTGLYYIHPNLQRLFILIKFKFLKQRVKEESNFMYGMTTSTDVVITKC